MLLLPPVTILVAHMPPPAFATQLHIGAPFLAPAIDPRAEAILARVAEKTATLHSLSAEIITLSQTTAGEAPAYEQKSEEKVRLQKPNLGYYESQLAHKDSASGPWLPTSNRIYASDGKTNWFVWGGTPQDTRYIATPPTSRSRFSAPLPLPVSGFFDRVSPFQNYIGDARRSGRLIALKYLGHYTWEGEDYELVSVTTRQRSRRGLMTITTTLYVDAEGLVHHTQEESTAYHYHATDSTSLHNLRVDSPMTPADFDYTPPPGARSANDIP